MPVLCWYTGIRPPSFFDLRCNSMSRADGLPFIFFVMPLFLIVLGSSGIGAAIALYILRKYDDPNT